MCPHPELFDECRVVRAYGELDLTTLAPLAHTLDTARARTGRLFLIVDLTQVTFADGSILDPLCAAWSDSRSRRGWTRVVYRSTSTALVFLAGGLSGRFPAYASTRDAWHGVVTAARPAAADVPASTRTATATDQ
ncbi:STAS domain-containing protein [Streptomyces sp. NPDC003011]